MSFFKQKYNKAVKEPETEASSISLRSEGDSTVTPHSPPGKDSTSISAEIRAAIMVTSLSLAFSHIISKMQLLTF